MSKQLVMESYNVGGKIMSKQLVMESYVDECLDEVEIRELYIVEVDVNSSDPKRMLIKKLWSKLQDAQTQEYKQKKIIHLLKLKKDRNIFTLPSTRDKIGGRLVDEEEKLKLLTKNKEHIRQLLNQAQKDPGMLGNLPQIFVVVGITLAVAAITYGSYKLYKRFMSKAAKACQSKKGKVKTICINQHQIKGLEASKKPLTDGLKGCSKAKEVQTCKSKFNKKINAINSKITKKQNKIKKLMSK